MTPSLNTITSHDCPFWPAQPSGKQQWALPSTSKSYGGRCSLISSTFLLGALPAVLPAPCSPPGLIKLGCKARKGHVIDQIQEHSGGRQCPVPKGATYRKPVHRGGNQLTCAGSLQPAAGQPAGCPLEALRVRNSNWFGEVQHVEDSMRSFSWIHSITPSDILTPSGHQAVHKNTEM